MTKLEFNRVSAFSINAANKNNVVQLALIPSDSRRGVAVASVARASSSSLSGHRAPR